ncbi:MAG: CBS domain-containing protein [Deltaproteobacteria bacterium]|nr:CBS domain-containing protein [Deltaproteobacteria bacterium]MBW2602198.1 CBS domain-containing protein [Deltaproteobacteria bacterium]
MSVAKIMTRKVLRVGMDDTLETMHEIFQKHKFHHLLVVEEDELVGVISDRDLLKEVSPFLNTPSEDYRDKQTLRKKAHQIMTRKAISVDGSTTIEDAAKILLKKNISCLPILTPEGKIQGILSWKDLLRFFVERTVS